MKKLIIIPTYNERNNIQVLINKISSLKINDLEILVVDDNSPDGTSEIVNVMKNKYKKIHLIKRSGRLGLGTAYIEGFNFALKNNFSLIFTMDADLSHNPDYIKEMLKRIDEGCDVAIGSRYIPGGGVVNWGIFRKLISRSANILAKIILNISAHDVTSGYRCYRKEVLRKIDLSSIKSNGYSFLEEMLYKCKINNFRIGEIPIIFTDRIHGKSKLNKKEILKFFITLIRLRLIKY